MTKRRWLPALAFAALWMVVAIFNEDVTYHLAPVIVAAAPALPSSQRRGWWSLAGFGLASGVSLVLFSLGDLSGPSLLPVGGALFESVVGAFAGSAIGFALAGRMVGEG